jgi:hypothetical protein
MASKQISEYVCDGNGLILFTFTFTCVVVQVIARRVYDKTTSHADTQSAHAMHVTGKYYT